MTPLEIREIARQMPARKAAAVSRTARRRLAVQARESLLAYQHSLRNGNPDACRAGWLREAQDALRRLIRAETGR